ncbi:hypothetical protein NC653_010880 [Populus alba x Populus x berolinensis]|uniref:Uncharacterized protein n=1 Tax=Populus alba x Populus x berolinensis TaxID=444605 RepID=A0AAD6R1Z3_9ROSI|nr:hypothetical protein NC653_010880 [Populus alba x Populus x berolinensis]
MPPLGVSETAGGVGTVGLIGSAGLIMLAVLAFKRKWQKKRKAEGKPCDQPNIVHPGSDVQSNVIIARIAEILLTLLHGKVFWEKFR